MANTGIKLNGLNSLIEKVKKMSVDIQEDVKDAVEEVTKSIELDAVANAPSAGDKLRTQNGEQKNTTSINQFIDSKFDNNGYTGIVFIEARASRLAAYIEFGTGTDAAGYVPTLPKEFQDIARRYYVNGKGTLLKQPFLIPAYFKHAPILEKKIKAIIAKK